MASNIAGQTRDESQALNCPKCKAAMEKVTFGGTTVDRCVSCKGLWFDASERDQLKAAEGSEVIDAGKKAAPASTPVTGTLACPVCKTRMIRMTDLDQRHLKFDSCTVCFGVFFEAGEFRDFKEFTVTETVKRLFRRG